MSLLTWTVSDGGVHHADFGGGRYSVARTRGSSNRSGGVQGEAAAEADRCSRGFNRRSRRADTVYKIVDVVGVSTESWEDAGRNAVETAAGSLRDLRVAEVTKMDMKVENGKVAAFRTRVSLSFKYGG